MSKWHPQAWPGLNVSALPPQGCVFSIRNAFSSFTGVAHVPGPKRWCRWKMCDLSEEAIFFHRSLLQFSCLYSHCWCFWLCTGNSMGTLTYLQLLTQQTPKLQNVLLRSFEWQKLNHADASESMSHLWPSVLSLASFLTGMNMCRVAILHGSCSFTDVLGPCQTQEHIFANFSCFQHVNFEDKPCSCSSTNPTLEGAAVKRQL